eukprot:jgi/Chrzof1/9401/Cz04g01190.t1
MSGPGRGGASTSGKPQLPDDAVSMRKILRSMGVEEHEPRVVNMLLDFMYKYVSEVLVDAESYAEHSGAAPGEVDIEDVMLAIQARSAHSFVQQPTQELLAEIANASNASPLPDISKGHGLRLPKDTECLTNANWKIIPKAKQR